MKKLSDYRIPFSGLKNGTHYFNFEVDEVFWDSFPERLVESGRVFVDLSVDKRNRITALRFDLGGEVNVECDRCTAEFALPVTGHHKLYVKPRSGAERDEDDEDNEDLILIDADESELDLSQILYELIQISLPIQKSCDDLPGVDQMSDDELPCDFGVLEQMDGFKEEKPVDPRWAGLQNLTGDTAGDSEGGNS